MSSNREIKQPESNAAKHHKLIQGRAVHIVFRLTWIVASLISILLAGISMGKNFRNALLEPSANWDLINSTSLVFVFYTIISVIVTHKVDKGRHGRGITDAYKKLPREKAMVTDAGIISALMARQSIHIAIALGLLVVIIQGKFLDPRQNISTLSDIFNNFRTCVAWIVMGGLSVSVVLILVSALCHDYSCRFGWTDDFKRNLLRKGLKLDNWSWYAFTVSLILSIALVSPFLCILMNTLYGFLLLYYYFFTFPKAQEKI